MTCSLYAAACVAGAVGHAPRQLGVPTVYYYYCSGSRPVPGSQNARALAGSDIAAAATSLLLPDTQSVSHSSDLC